MGISRIAYPRGFRCGGVGRPNVAIAFVVQTFREVIGTVPANGVGHDELVEHWNVLEPRLRAEIARGFPTDDA
jgi:hypothetical protein